MVMLDVEEWLAEELVLGQGEADIVAGAVVAAGLSVGEGEVDTLAVVLGLLTRLEVGAGEMLLLVLPDDVPEGVVPLMGEGVGSSEAVMLGLPESVKDGEEVSKVEPVKEGEEE